MEDLVKSSHDILALGETEAIVVGNVVVTGFTILVEDLAPLAFGGLVSEVKRGILAGTGFLFVTIVGFDLKG